MPIKQLLVALCILLSASCWADENSSTPVEIPGLEKVLTEGAQFIQARKPAEAIPYFDRVIAGYEETYKGEEAKLYCARWQIESLMYLLESATAKTPAKLISPNWAFAYYMKAYSLLEIGRIADAKASLERAIALSPRNSQFLSEMGNIYQREKNWPKAMEVFLASESAAREFSPPDLKNVELARALRGLGYVYIELGRLDDASKMYRQCLEIDATDVKALNELRYIQGLKAKLNTQ